MCIHACIDLTCACVVFEAMCNVNMRSIDVEDAGLAVYIS